MKGNIFDIQRFSVHDGPGIRTTVFFKGCPLRCIWCHNPESQSCEASLAYYPKSCIGCGACAAACPSGAHRMTDEGMHIFDRALCISCGACAAACPSEALVSFGKSVDVSEIMDEVLRDKSFYENSGGGLTVSGGEPLMQGEFLVELLSAAKAAGLHTAIETSGFGSRELLCRVAEYTDLFLFDIKTTGDEAHRRLTGVPQSPIRENLLLLDSLGANIVLRCPLIPGVNTTDEHYDAIAKLALTLRGVSEVNVMAYHTLGDGKYDALDMENEMASADAMTAEEKAACIENIKRRIIAGGKDIKVV
ncbi:MAG: glycyl-radical enzyme activating protein [Clostridia bacterium]|nr:glycyl-radical enzyme activating protein [Clostridia bacterium]